MIVTPITNGIVLDHIQAGTGMELYEILNLGGLKCPVVLITNADSVKMGKKDVIKIDSLIELNLDIIGYIAPGVTVNTIRDGVLEKRTKIKLPGEIRDVIKCNNPRCITTTEQELPHVFRLTDPENRIYRCIYCESKAKNNKI